ARNAPDLSDLRGQETARHVLEIAAAGRHNLLMIGPPGAGKSMLAARLPGLLPPLSPREALDVTMLHSIAGQLPAGGLVQSRPFRDPHHSASMAALVGGGARARPGEISLAHGGVLFLDELAEFAKTVLDALRQPLETGQVVVARANHHVTYPARFQLIAAMNPCRCGYLGDPARACTRAPDCGRIYCSRVSGPMLDRFDMVIEVPEVSGQLLLDRTPGEASAVVARRVAAAHEFAARRPATTDDAPDAALQEVSRDATSLLELAIEKISLSARGFHRVLKVARTIADLQHQPVIDRSHLAEALAYRAMPLLA
ncbi:MAG: YifB family Mg chelatase-like AAA ATPase, partial [Alphaproteobacteria bacterium]